MEEVQELSDFEEIPQSMIDVFWKVVEEVQWMAGVVPVPSSSSCALAEETQLEQGMVQQQVRAVLFVVMSTGFPWHSWAGGWLP